MSSSAGILTLCFVLSVNLCTLTASPVPLCKMKEMLKLLEYEFTELNKTLKMNHARYNSISEIIHPLVIDKKFPVHKQNRMAACGLLYMAEALKVIRDHQSNVAHDEQIQNQFNNMIIRLTEHIPTCKHHHILVKCDHVTQPEFPDSHFQAKKWTRSFLDSSVKFLHQVIHLIEKPKTIEEHHGP